MGLMAVLMASVAGSAAWAQQTPTLPTNLPPGIPTNIPGLNSPTVITRTDGTRIETTVLSATLRMRSSAEAGLAWQAARRAVRPRSAVRRVVAIIAGLDPARAAASISDARRRAPTAQAPPRKSGLPRSTPLWRRIR